MAGKDEASKIIEGISVSLLTAPDGDLRKVGEIMSDFDRLRKTAEADGWVAVADGASAADAILTALMFRDDLLPKRPRALEMVTEVARFCQEALRSDKPSRTALTNIISAAKSELGIEIEVAGEPAPAAAPVASASPKAVEPVALDQDKELYTDFITESMEHLQAIEVKMVDLEAAPDDKENINAIFRGFHTIKGVSGFLNLKDVNELAHKTETLLDMCRQGNLAVTASIIDVVFEAIDVIRGMIQDVSSRLAEGAPDRLPFDITTVVAHILAAQKGEPVGSTAAEQTPLLGDVLVAQGKVSRKDLEAAVVEQLGKVEHEPIGKTLIDDKKVTPKDVAQALRAQKAGAAVVEAQDIRVDIRKLDMLVDMVGELVISQSLVLNDGDVRKIDNPKFYRNMSQLGRITTELQKVAMSMRMVPVRNTFQKMSRLVRDLARKSGKEVALLMEGEETEIDRNMIEEIHDPLVHMIRNSVDHGVESPAVRTAAGKSAFGTVTLRAFHQGGNVVLGVEDDGKGLDADKILAKARERGIVSPNANLSESEIFALVFEAGFSTAEKVTDISGRGVGMDVVRKNVERLRGVIEIKSILGKGATFSMKLPLTLAIIDGIVVRVGTERYVLPTINVVESFRPRREDYFTVERRGELIRVREELLPLVRLGRLFHRTVAHVDPWDGLLIVIEYEREKRALLVDELLGKQEVVIKSLGGGMQSIKGLSGGAIMGDGRVGLILDVAGIFETTGARAASA